MEGWKDMGTDTLVQQELFDKCESIDTSKPLKTCVKCNKTKPLDSFKSYGYNQKTTGLPSTERVCKSCANERNRQTNELRLVTPPPSKDYRCPICLTNSEDNKQRNNKWCLDHNHDTGEARGWLCHKCNSALGWLNDNSTTIRRALKYLEGYKK